MKRLYCLIVLSLLCGRLAAQHLHSFDFRDASLAAVLDTLAAVQDEYSISFIHNELEHLRISARIKNQTIKDAVEKVCKGQPVKVKTRSKQIFVQYKPEKDFSDKTIQIAGSVRDAFLKIPLKDVKVTVHRMDSTVVVDSIENIDIYGGHKLMSVMFYADVKANPREYLVHAQLDGYDDVWQKVTITNPKEERVGAEIEMRRSRARTMKEVTVTATRIKMYYRGDTLIYDATAFKMPDGSMLDDLIRQLPDVTMNDDGEIFVKGRKVDELLLGSRSFFGGNKRVLMENLPYYTVKHLKVYEKQTDKSVALGYDVEPRQYVMDVILKDEYKQGYIGNVEAAGGTQERWLARAFLLGYADNLRFTLLGNVNNVNESRHIGEAGHWTPEQAPRSMLTTRSAGAEIDYHTDEDKLQETFRAEFTSTTDEQTMRQRYEQFLEGCKPTSLTESFNRKGNRKLKLSNTLALHKPLWLSFSANFDYAHRDGSFHSAFDQWNDSLTASQRSVGMSEGTAWSGGASIIGAINIGGEKQHIDFFASLKHDDEQSEQASRYATQSLQQTNLRHNTNDISNRTTSGRVQLSYNKDLSDKLTLKIEDVLNLNNQRTHDYLYHPDTLALASQLDALAAITDPSNSYDAHHRETANTLAVQLHKSAFRSLIDGGPVGSSYDKYSLRLELPVRHESLNYQRGSLDTLARQDNIFLNLSGGYGFTFDRDRNFIHIGAHHSRYAADLMDRITYRDNSQPLVVKVGNPDLSGKVESGVGVSYNYGFANFHRHALNASGGFTYLHRDVAQSVNYNPASGVYTYQPMNISGAYNAYVNFSFDQAIDEKRYWNWHTNGDIKFDHAKDHAMLAGEIESHENTVNTLTLHDGAYIQYKRNQLNLRATGDISWRHSEGKMYDFSTLNALDFRYGLSAKYTTPALAGKKVGGMTLAADATMYSRRGYGSAPLNTDDFVLNASLSQPFMNGKLILRLEGFDLLHQLSATQYVVNAQGRTETWYRSLPHYLMLHAVWHFNKNPKKKE